ncbi:INOSITOL-TETRAKISPHOSPHATE 1-KINASE [Salix purpurea]|uniref:INOSITOL-TETRAKISPHOSPHATE 1-KINASE n=1 Tax=Salix purpurea TaxID=77065 RepID=A0A9Q0VAK8_SALPP|nr:INOSITOL-TETRAKISPHOSPHATE 1-KINASE [Salix purpurea]
MSSSTHSKRHRVGYALPPKKIQAFIKPSLIHHADQHNIDLIPIDPSKPLIEQGPLDCVIHKLYGLDWKSQLLHFSSLNPDALIIDPLDSIQRIHNRISMLQVVSNLKVSERKQVLDVPRQLVFSDSETMMKNSDDLIQKLGFPLIAKPLMADGSETSHKMYLVFDKGRNRQV